MSYDSSKSTKKKILQILLLSYIFLLAYPAMGQTIQDIPCPSNYQRLTYPNESYANFIQQLPFRSGNNISTIVGEQKLVGIWGAIDMPLLFPQQDLEQCADWAMRLWADYHKANGKLNKLYLFEYSGKKTYFRDKPNYRLFLKQAFAFSNSYSLKKGTQSIKESLVMPGDMFIQNTNGGIGHVTVVLDACLDKLTHKSYFLIGYSYMPAQEMRIVKANDSYGKEGWFSKEGIVQYLDDYFGGYGEASLHRFETQVP